MSHPACAKGFGKYKFMLTTFFSENNLKYFFLFCTGPVVGKFCIDLAIKKAKDVGIGWVCATRKYLYTFFTGSF